MNDEAARQGRLAPVSITCLHCNPEAGLKSYGGERAVRCPKCGHVSPSSQHLDRHLLRFCCGALGRAA